MWCIRLAKKWSDQKKESTANPKLKQAWWSRTSPRSNSHAFWGVLMKHHTLFCKKSDSSHCCIAKLILSIFKWSLTILTPEQTTKFHSVVERMPTPYQDWNLSTQSIYQNLWKGCEAAVLWFSNSGQSDVSLGGLEGCNESQKAPWYIVRIVLVGDYRYHRNRKVDGRPKSVSTLCMEGFQTGQRYADQGKGVWIPFHIVDCGFHMVW